MKCVYCELPEIKERIIIKTDYAFAFPTNIPIVPGHLLVCPNKCVSKLEDLSEEEFKGIFDLISKMKEVLKKTFDAEGFNCAWNEGNLAGQNVPHLHFHILPRKENDTGITEYDPRKFLYRSGSRETTQEKELKSIVELVRKNL